MVEVHSNNWKWSECSDWFVLRTDDNVYLENHVNRNINNYLNLYCCCCCCDGIDISINRWKTTAILLVVLIVEKYTVSRFSLRFASSLVCWVGFFFEMKRFFFTLCLSMATECWWLSYAQNNCLDSVFFFHHWNKLFCTAINVVGKMATVDIMITSQSYYVYKQYTINTNVFMLQWLQSSIRFPV